jgi:multiple sugar transport system permease protein
MKHVMRLGGHLAYALFFAWTLGPILWLFLTSIKSQLDAFRLPPVWRFIPTFENYAVLLSNPAVTHAFLNSLIVSVASTLLVLVLAVAAGYAFSRFRFPGRNASAFALIGTRMFPPVVVVPSLFAVLRGSGLYDTRIVLIVLYASFTVSFSAWMMKAFFDDIPTHIEEAALVDGYSRFGAFMRVTLPICAPGLIATAIFTFVLAWNEFFFAFMFTSARAVTAPVEFVGIILRETGIEWNLMAAGACLLMLPTLALSWFIQRYFVRGLGLGAVKG